jgi:peptide/nickel transport system ATP-binding protein/oligopeptide transport system ATP-binding protein
MALLEVSSLVKVFTRGDGLPWRGHAVRAVDGVSLAIEPRQTFGLVGESGCGKTTLARCILRLIEPTSGEIRFDGQDVRALAPRPLRQLRRRMQMVFQDPYSSLDPRMRAGAIVEEPLIVHRAGTRLERTARVAELFDLVGLARRCRDCYPHEFSGGQRQRIAIARALALNPSFIVADEPVSALDVSVQAQVINLLLDLQQRLGLTYLLVSHDLRTVRHVCDRVVVMYRGRIVEAGSTVDVLGSPRHPYTQALVSAVPALEPGCRTRRIVFDVASFDPRLPLQEVAPGHSAAV